MDELLDMIVSDESPAQISDKLKDILYAKSVKRLIKQEEKLNEG